MQLYMPTVASSTCVTGRHISYPNSVPCGIADQKMGNSQMLDLHMYRWFSGRASPATRRVRVRFPDDADYIFHIYVP